MSELSEGQGLGLEKAVLAENSSASTGVENPSYPRIGVSKPPRIDFR